MTTPIPLPPARGPAYDRRLQSFLKHGEVYRMHNRFIIIRKLVSRDINGFDYGLCCFGCGNITWKYQDVTERFCPSCGVNLADQNAIASTG